MGKGKENTLNWTRKNNFGMCWPVKDEKSRFFYTSNWGRVIATFGPPKF